MGRLARIVALASAGLIALSAGESVNPGMLYAQAKRPVKTQPSADEVKNLAKAIEIEIKVRGLNDPKNLYQFSGATEKEEKENKWRVAHETANPNLVAVIFPAHMGLLQRGYYDDVLIASAPLLSSLGFYQIKNAPHSLDDIRGVLQSTIPYGHSFNFLKGKKGQELLKHPVKFSGLENGRALEIYSQMQELARFIASRWQRDFNLMHAEAEITALYEKIGTNNLPEYTREIWGNGQAYRKFMQDLRFRIHEAEKRRMHEASKIIVEEFKMYKGTEQFAKGIVWDPLYIGDLAKNLASANISRIEVTSGVNDYFTWNRMQNNHFTRLPEPK